MLLRSRSAWTALPLSTMAFEGPSGLLSGRSHEFGPCSSSGAHRLASRSTSILHSFTGRFVAGQILVRIEGLRISRWARYRLSAALDFRFCRHLPVEILAEFGNWRGTRDADGDAGRVAPAGGPRWLLLVCSETGPSSKPLQTKLGRQNYGRAVLRSSRDFRRLRSADEIVARVFRQVY